MKAPIFNFGDAGRPTQFGRICVPYEPWLELQAIEPALDPDLPIIDTHHHLWDHSGYRYLLPEFIADISGGHKIVATVYAECMSMYRADDHCAEQLRPVGEIEFAVGQSAQSASGQFGTTRVADAIIGFADLNLGSAVEEVLLAESDASNGRLRGIRFSTNSDSASEIIGSPHDDRPHVLAEAPIREGLKTLAKLGMTYDSWCFFPQLGDVIDAVDAVPELTFVINHCGGPLGYGPYAHDKNEHFSVWRAHMRQLAQRPNVVCKIGGILQRGAAIDYLHDETPPTSEVLAATWRPWFETVIEYFGADRCMFESNFPVEKMGTNYTTLWNSFKRVTSGASDSERRALFAGTASRIYRVPL